MLSESQLRQIMPNLSVTRLTPLLPHLNSAMAEYGINTAARTAAFVAQLAHESGEFRWMEEIWGPTSAQRRYEPPSDLSRQLGNVQPGDGKRFKGRGPIQLTGRANYQRFGKLLGVDLVAAPERAAAPDVAFRIAALYWANRGLNELADAQNFREITRRINGGFNGLADRLRYFERARAVLAAGFARAARSVARSGTTAPVRGVPAEPLTRGFEAIQALKPRQKRAKKTTAKTSVKRKTPAGKPTARKVAAKKVAARKVVARKALPKKTAPTKAARKKAPAARKRAVRRAGKRASAAPRATRR
jgi:predicted chitinase